MIAQWMAYVVGISILLSVAALLAESVLSRHRLPVRWAWVAAIGGAVTVPVFAAAWRGVRSGAAGSGEIAMAGGVAIGGGFEGPADAAPSGMTITELVDPVLLIALDRPLLVLWAVFSGSVVAFLAASHLSLRRRRRGWRAGVIEGTPVWRSSDIGPAVVGFFRRMIVVPTWVDRLTAEERRLLVAHEGEHLRAGDPLLILGAIGMLVLMPWNPVLWWQLRRLRAAIEIDCDARVLRRSASLGAYGSLLLEVGRRSTRAPFAAAAFSEPATQLERRIRMMIREKARRNRLATGTVAAAATLALLASCAVDQPQTPQMPTASAAGDPPGRTIEVAAPEGNGTESALNERNERARLELESVSLEADRIVTSEARSEASPATFEATADAIVRAREEQMAALREQLVATRARPVEPPASPQSAGANAAGPEEPMFTPLEVQPTLRNASAIAAQIERRYPPLLKDAGIGGTATIWVYLSEQGRILETRIYRSTGYPALDQIAEEVIRVGEFSPAMNRDQPVPVWIQIPVTFRAEN